MIEAAQGGRNMNHDLQAAWTDLHSISAEVSIASEGVTESTTLGTEPTLDDDEARNDVCFHCLRKKPSGTHCHAHCCSPSASALLLPLEPFTGGIPILVRVGSRYIGYREWPGLTGPLNSETWSGTQAYKEQLTTGAAWRQVCSPHRRRRPVVNKEFPPETPLCWICAFSKFASATEANPVHMLQEAPDMHTLLEGNWGGSLAPKRERREGEEGRPRASCQCLYQSVSYCTLPPFYVQLRTGTPCSSTAR
eukprot:2582505-Rhodomonas_salina.1